MMNNTKICFTGDMAFSGFFHSAYEKENLIDNRILSFINDSQGAVINFENVITETFDELLSEEVNRTQVSALEYLTSAFQNPVLSLANEHAMDLGKHGLAETITTVSNSNIPCIGVSSSGYDPSQTVIIGDDIKVGIVSVFHYDGEEPDQTAAKKAIHSLKEQANYVVVLFHGGDEFAHTPMPSTRKLFKQYLGYGADIVIGHHPHTVQGYEKFGKKMAFYSLGSFLRDNNYNRAHINSQYSVILSIDFSENGFSFDSMPTEIIRREGRVAVADKDIHFDDVSKYGYSKLVRCEAKRLRNSIKLNNAEITKQIASSRRLLVPELTDKIVPSIHEFISSDGDVSFEDIRQFIGDEFHKFNRRLSKENLNLFARFLNENRECSLSVLEDYTSRLLMGQILTEENSAEEKRLARIMESEKTKEIIFHSRMYKVLGKKDKTPWGNDSSELKAFDKYVVKVAQTSGLSPDVAEEAMTVAKHQYGIPFREYSKRSFYDLNLTLKERAAKRYFRRLEVDNAIYADIERVTGMSEEETRRQVREMKELGIVPLTIMFYYICELFRYEGDELIERLRTLRRAKATVFPESQSEVDSLYEMLEYLVGDLFVESKRELVESSYIGPVDGETLRKIVIDIVATSIMFLFNENEYLSFRFSEKTIDQRRGYLCANIKNKYMLSCNDEEFLELLNDKYRTYEMLNEYYYRKIIEVADINDLEKFENFCEGLDTFVFKPTSASFGRGVMPVKTAEIKDRKKFVEDSLRDCGRFIAEELIVANDVIKGLYPSSVNTVRIYSIRNGETIHIPWATMRIGQGGSFIDNGAAGGIFAFIDLSTGKFVGDGVDEKGRIYKVHPDTDTVIDGFALPNFKGVMDTTRNLAAMMPDKRIIGWDLTCNAEGNWVVIEANGTPGLIGPQATKGSGIREDYIRLMSEITEPR